MNRKNLVTPLLADDRGYLLVANKDGTYSMGCRNNYSFEMCMEHWGKDYNTNVWLPFDQDQGASTQETRKKRAAAIRKAIRDHQKGLPVKFKFIAISLRCVEFHACDFTNVEFPKKTGGHRIDFYIGNSYFDGDELVLPTDIDSVEINNLQTTGSEICVTIGKYTELEWD